jgi:hypothetical protein
MATSFPLSSLPHCNCPLSLPLVYISSPNNVGAVAAAIILCSGSCCCHRSNCHDSCCRPSYHCPSDLSNIVPNHSGQYTVLFFWRKTSGPVEAGFEGQEVGDDTHYSVLLRSELECGCRWEMVAGARRKSKSDIVLSTLAVSLHTE